jgi:type IV pilus secretin PilQ/predicted competence protein
MVSIKSNIVARALVTLVVATSGAILATDVVNAESTVVAKNQAPKKAAVQTAVTSPISQKSTNSITTSVATGVNYISIPTGVESPKYSITRVSSPERLVVDLEVDNLANARSSKTPELQYVSGVRVGAHPGKTRIVLDLKGGKELAHEARLDKGALTIALSAGAAAKVVAASAAVAELPKIQDKEIAVKNSETSKLMLEEEPIASGSSVVNAVSSVESDTVVNQPVVLPQAELEKTGTVAADRASLSLDKSILARKFISRDSDQLMSPSEVVNDELPLDQFKVFQTQDLQPVNYTHQLLARPAENNEKVLEAKEIAKDESVAAQKVEQKVETKVEVKSEQKPDPVKAEVVTEKIFSVVIDSSANTSPALVIGIKKDVEYSMNRTAPSEYVVTIKKISAAPALLQQPVFAAPNSSGIRSARVVNEGGDTLVRIFAQASSYLTLKRVGDTLRVEETQDLAQVARDIRAQIAPASAKEGEKQPAGKDPLSLGKDTPKSQEKTEKSDKSGLEQQFSGPDQSELAAINGSSSTYTGRLISLDLQDADIDSALRIIAEVSNLNIVASDGVVGKVTLKLVDVPWDQALEVILKSHGLDRILEGNVLRVAPVDKLRNERESFKQAKVAEEELEPLNVKYIRVSYAKASEIKTLVETVLSDRGSVAFDERSNQLVVKDTKKGLQNVVELIKKVDLRTPQILLETQIVEANRNLSRKLGAELGFQYIQSPATGNGTGLNFPSAISMGGSADTRNPSSNTGSAFPVESSALLGSAVTMLFDSADGAKSLALRLSQLEQEGQVRIISKPAVATTNNKPAEIKSVEKYRVKLPNGGLSIASGSGAQSSGSGDVATQTIEAGIILNVTPQASPDYYILLDIKAKSSSFGSQRVDGIPNEIERSASSSVLVSSGQTFALGGIYKITEQDSVAGVPFLKDIPVLGTFFRSNITEHTDEELLFFITPRIVEGSFEDATTKVIS